MYYIIMNPLSGRGKSCAIAASLCRLLEQNNLPYNIKKTTAPGEARTLTAISCQQTDCSALLAIGGDGTFNEVLNGMDLRLPLCLIPAGTGNDLARALPLTADPTEILNLLQQNTLRAVDYLQVNDLRCLNIFGTGIDVTILRNEQMLRRYFRHISYILGLLKAIMFLKFYPAQISIDDAPPVQETILEIVAANGRCFGNGLMIAPDSDYADGLADVVILKKFPLYKAPYLFFSFLKGNILKTNYADLYRCRTMSCSLDNYTFLEVDGEIYEDLPAQVELKAGALQLYLK